MTISGDILIKRCACGREYSALTWAKLPRPREITYEWGEVHEMRDCTCGSSIVIVLAPGRPEEEDL